MPNPFFRKSLRWGVDDADDRVRIDAMETNSRPADERAWDLVLEARMNGLWNPSDIAKATGLDPELIEALIDEQQALEDHFASDDEDFPLDFDEYNEN